MPTHIITNAKAYAALIGSSIAAVLALVPPHTQLWTGLSIVAVICTSIATWRIPNPSAVSVSSGTAETVATIVRRTIPESVVEGKRLGRHVHHDSRSLAYTVPEGSPTTARWERATPVLDQGQVGSCTGNAAAGHLGTAPEYATLAAKIAAGMLQLDEAEALRLYSAAEIIDGGAGYPPEDQGSSGLSVAKAAKAAGLISGYVHMTSIGACYTAIKSGPFINGSNWYTSMDSPDANGRVTISGSVRGGHEYEVIGYDATTDLWECVNSWGTGYGVGGHFFMSSPDFARLLSEQGDATQFVPLSSPAPTPVPPSPTPTPGDPVHAFLAAVPAGWETARHIGGNAVVAKAVQALRKAVG